MKLLSLLKLNYKKHISELVLLIILFFALFVPNIFTRTILSVFLLIYTLILIRFFKVTEKLFINNNKVKLQMIIFAIIYVIGHFMLGIFFEYYVNPVRFSVDTVITFMIPLAIIIITSEILRNIFVSQKDKISSTLVTIIMVLIELVLYLDMYNMKNLNDILTVLGLIVFSSISCSLLYNYMCSRFSYKSIIIYRLITTLYIYIIPILPDAHTFFRTTLRIIYPYVIYLFLEYMYAKEKVIITKQSKSIRIINSMVVIGIGILITMIISCKFYVGILTIGSESMAGTIDKGDALVFVKYIDQEISEGDIIVFNKGNIIVIHRVINIIKNNDENRYYTKGDSNPKEDDGYITDSDIMGISKFRIRYIGYPSLWLSSIF